MKNLDKKAVWLFFFSNIGGMIILFLFFGFSIFSLITTLSNPLFVLLSAIVLLILFFILAYAIARLTWHFYRYEITDLGFKKESGIIWKKYVTIPYDRIQNVDIHRGLIGRLLGLSDLQIQTAGASVSFSGRSALGMAAEGLLPGLSKEDAEQMRDDLIRRASKNRSNNSGL